MAASRARLAATSALIAVEEGAHLEEVLDRLAPPEGADRDLAWFLAFGVLRRRGHVDAALRAVLSQPIHGLDAPVRAVLRVGAFELLYARTRPHAAVHQAVEVARALRSHRATGLVNAVLRRLRPPERIGEADALDHPAWLVARWKARYGVEATRRWCEANAEPPPLFVVARPDFPPPPEWSPVLAAGTPVPGVYRAPVGEGRIPDRPGFASGGWWVADLASVRVADLVPAEGVVLDACSAPGGKTFRLASRGARVVSADIDAARLERVAQGAVRLDLADRVETVRIDWTAPPSEPDPRLDRPFDAVLVDAPCTGLGTVRRHPEIRWKRTEPDLYRAAALQEQIAVEAARRVRPGGVLVYAVCSPEPEEGEEIVARLASRLRDFEIETTLSTAPPEQGEDAHYAARLRRKA